MSSPLGPDDKPDKAEKDSAADKADSASTLSYEEVMKRQSGEQAERRNQERNAGQSILRDAITRSGGMNGSARSPFTYFMGQKPQYQIRKSEFLQAKNEMKSRELKPLVDDFLKDTIHKDEHRLTDAELRELEKTRESLAKVTNSEDALKTALHLAKLYQHLHHLEEAKKATDLSLGIDPDNAAGRQLFRELEKERNAEVGSSPLVFSKHPPLDKSSLRQRIMSLTGGKIIVVGDMILDEYVEGRPERISREAPVLILEHINSQYVLGGAANAAHNIAALGGTCRAIGICGRDQQASKLAELFERSGITQGLVQDTTRPTTVKTRILSTTHSFKQQLLRLDKMSREPIGALAENLLIDRLKQAAGSFDAILISDYRGGVITDGLVKACSLIGQEKRLKVVVDAQDRLERFQGVYGLTPNEPDAEKAVGYALDSEEALNKAGHDLLTITGAEFVLITRGSRGMTLFQQNTDPVNMPTFNRSEVFDVTGAGDTVVATMTLALVTGSSIAQAVALGNLAAGVVVKKTGTAVTNQVELLADLERSELPY